MKDTEPKLVRAMIWQRLRLQSDGASATTSADDQSGTDTDSVVENVWPVVAFVSDSVAVLSEPLTSAASVSPGETVSGTGVDAAGSSSYQASYVATPRVQLEEVPICSRPREPEA